MRKVQRLIIFFIPPDKMINGGILSIFSICQISRKFRDIHGAEVVLSTLPGYQSYRKNDLFENDETIYSFDELVERGVPEFLQLHVPEYASYVTFWSLEKYTDYLKAVSDLRVNIMNQNILLMQKPVEVANWFSLTTKVTQTTAHNKYSTQELADKYNLPTHHFSTFVDPRQYKSLPFTKKDDLIVLSPDETSVKAEIVKKLVQEFPTYEIVTIQNMSYETYKNIARRAKFIVTFGEGFDGYFVEGFFSGGITFAVYNDQFFPDKTFASFENTYPDYTTMLKNITTDMHKLNNEMSYEKVVQKNFNKITTFYSFSSYQENIKNFYKGKFTYVPQQPSAEKLIGEVTADRNSLIIEKDEIIRQKDQLIGERDEIIRQKDQLIGEILNSRSWKVTKPLRKASSTMKRRRSNS